MAKKSKELQYIDGLPVFEASNWSRLIKEVEKWTELGLYNGEPYAVRIKKAAKGETIVKASAFSSNKCDAKDILSKMTKLIIPDYVTEIERYAFFGSIFLKQIEISGSVKKIGEEAFSGCGRVETLIIHHGVESIGKYVFMRCSSLTEVTIPGSVKDIGNFAFQECKNLKQVIIEEGVEELWSRLFYDCTSLERIVLPNSIRSVFGTFINCPNLKEVVVKSLNSDLVNKIKESCAPAGAQLMKLVSLEPLVSEPIHNGEEASDSGLEYIDGMPVYEAANCDELTKEIEKWTNLGVYHIGQFWVRIPKRIRNWIPTKGDSKDSESERIGFGWSLRITHLIIPKSVETLGEGAFRDLENLQKVIFEDGVANIPKNAFTNCKSLKEIHLPNTLKQIGADAFWWCESLMSIEIPDGVTEVRGFRFCESLQSVKLPKSLTLIDDCAFSYCESLQEIDIPEGTTKIGRGAFDQCKSLTHANIPESVTEIEKQAFCNCNKLTEINIPKSIKIIKESAFERLKSLKELTIPDGVIEIEDRAFCGCSSIQRLKIPRSVIKIGMQAFAACSGLRIVEIENDDIKLHELAFFGDNIRSFLRGSTYNLDQDFINDEVKELERLREAQQVTLKLIKKHLESIGIYYADVKTVEDSYDQFVIQKEAINSVALQVTVNADNYQERCQELVIALKAAPAEMKTNLASKFVFANKEKRNWFGGYAAYDDYRGVGRGASFDLNSVPMFSYDDSIDRDDYPLPLFNKEEGRLCSTIQKMGFICYLDTNEDVNIVINKHLTLKRNHSTHQTDIGHFRNVRPVLHNSELIRALKMACYASTSEGFKTESKGDLFELLRKYLTPADMKYSFTPDGVRTDTTFGEYCADVGDQVVYFNTGAVDHLNALWFFVTHLDILSNIKSYFSDFKNVEVVLLG